MKTMRNTALLFLLLCGAGLTAAQAETNIGVIDSEQIIQAMPEYTQGEQMLTNLTKAYQDTLNAMNADLKKRLEAYQMNLGTMTADVKAKTEELLRNIQQQMQQYRQAKENEIQQRRTAILTPIREKILKAVNAVAADLKLDAVVDKKTGGMVFVSKKIDITYKVLDKIQQG